MKKENPFTLVSSKDIYKNQWIEVREDNVIRPGGNEGIFGFVQVAYGASVVALSPQNTIFLVREYKYGYGDYTIECPGGVIDEGENPKDAAVRELREEIGGESDEWSSLGHSVALPTIADYKEYFYLAKDVEIIVDQNTDEGEVIEIVEMPFAEAVEKVATGEIVHHMTCVAIARAHFLLNR